MADTTFVARVTHILATWLNDVNKAVYRAIGASGVAPQTPGEVITNLGLAATAAPSGASLIGFDDTGGISSDNVQDALVELDTEKAPTHNPVFTGIVQVNTDGVDNGDILLNGRLIANGNSTVSVTFPSGFTPSSGVFWRYAPTGNGGTVKSALFVGTQTQASTASFEWNQLNRLENFATAGENVGNYTQAMKNAAGATWSGVFESHDTTGVQPNAALYGIEVDVSANGSDVSGLGFTQRFGVQLVGYRNSAPAINVTASIATNVMTVTAVSGGTITNGMRVAGNGVVNDTTITSLGTGTGGTGTYNLSATPNVSSRSMQIGGGAVNHIGNGIVLLAAGSDPYGSVFTNGLTMGQNGDISIAHVGQVQVGESFTGTYSVCTMRSITSSAVPVISTVGSNNSALLQLASTDNMFNGAALGAYSGKIKVIVDGNPFYIPVYA